jgi:UDP-N-acetyl-D-mannosaminuronate dehydrogenase
MSTLLNIGIKQQDGSYKNYTLSLNDETNGYGQNVSVWESQTKEQQAAKEQRNFVGNGKVVWTDGNVKVADKVVTNTDHNNARNIKVNAAEVVADLPF